MSDTNGETNDKLIDIHNLLAGDKSIAEVEFLPVTLKRSITPTGLEVKSNLVGQTFRIGLRTLRAMRVETQAGRIIENVPVVNHYDANGRDLGFIWAELFFA